MRRVTTPRLVRARLRQNEATLLRAAGWSYSAIAEHLGYGGRGSACKAVKRVLDSTRDRASLVLRLMSRLRLERGAEAFASAVDTGDFREAMATVDRLLREVQDS